MSDDELERLRRQVAELEAELQRLRQSFSEVAAAPDMSQAFDELKEQLNEQLRALLRQGNLAEVEWLPQQVSGLPPGLDSSGHTPGIEFGSTDELAQEALVEGILAASPRREETSEAPQALPQVRYPRQALAVGRNYAAHAAELDNELPTAPLLFWKPVGCLVEGQCPLPRWPEGETPIHYEGEVVLVLGRAIGPGTPDLPADPWEAIAGIAPGLDLSDRALQKQEPQWVRAKGFYGAGALGPILPRPADPAAITVRTRLNGEPVQAGRTDALLFPLRPLLRYLHGFLRLDAGDVIYTGTPAGVGPVQPGDRLEVTVGAAEGERTLAIEVVEGAKVPAFVRD